MKTVLFVSLFSVVACAQGNTPSASVKTEDQPARPVGLCETYASPAFNASAFKTVNPANQELSSMEKGMVQTAVLMTDTSPVSVQQAIDIFTDKDSDGTLGGDIAYFKVKVGNREKTLAKVVYYPGDNEYGALFQVWTFEDGSQSAGMIGTIGDSDIYCLTYQDVE